MINPSTKTKSNPVKTNLILAGLLIAMSVFAYWYEFKKKGDRDRAEESKTKLIALDQAKEAESLLLVDKEKGINVEMACKEHCKLTDPNADWQLVTPIKFKADESNIGTFVTSLAGATIQETITLEGDPEAKLKDFGLAKEKRDDKKIVLKFKGDSQPYNIFVGDNAAVGENIYVYVTGPGQKSDAVRIIPGFLKANMQRNASYWRAKRVFNFAASEVEGIKLAGTSGAFDLVRKDGNWMLEPGSRMADNEAVDTYITGLVFMNAQEYASDDKKKDRAKLGLTSKPSATMNIKLAKKNPVNLEVYDLTKDARGKLYVIRDDKDYIVELDKTMADKFTKKASAFRFRNLLTHTEKAEIRKVQLTLEGKSKYTFESNDGAEWKLASGTIDKFDSATVNQALIKLQNARIADFLEKNTLPGGSAELSAWTLVDKGGKTLRELKVFGPAKGGTDYYVKLPTGELAKLEQGSGAAVPSKPTEFQKTEPVPAAVPPKTPAQK